MIKSFLSLAIFTSFFLISCSGSTSQFINEKYQNGEQPGSVSLLTIQESNFNGKFSYHTFGTLRANEVQLFEDFLTEFSIGAIDHSNGMLTQFDPSEFEKRSFETGNESFTSLTPTVGTTIYDDNQESRYIVIIDRYYFDQYEDIVASNSYAGHEQEVVPRLNFKTNYVIWDNEIGDAVAWGALEADRRIVLSRIEEIYDELLTESFNKMMAKSPFSAQI